MRINRKTCLVGNKSFSFSVLKIGRSTAVHQIGSDMLSKLNLVRHKDALLQGLISTLPPGKEARLSENFA